MEKKIFCLEKYLRLKVIKTGSLTIWPLAIQHFLIQPIYLEETCILWLIQFLNIVHAFCHVLVTTLGTVRSIIEFYAIFEHGQKYVTKLKKYWMLQKPFEQAHVLGVILTYFWTCRNSTYSSVVDSFSNPEVLAVIAKLW